MPETSSRLRSSAIERLVVTNTIPVPPEKRDGRIEVVSVAKLFADAITAIHTGSSISTLFN